MNASRTSINSEKERHLMRSMLTSLQTFAQLAKIVMVATIPLTHPPRLAIGEKLTNTLLTKDTKHLGS